MFLSTKRKTAGALVSALMGALLTVPAISVSAQSANLTLMPLGDSITAGYQSSTGNGYRGPLYNDLSSQGDTPYFVGSQSQGTMSDPYEEGHYGAEISALATSSGIWCVTNDLATYRPNIILLHIGSNDMNNNYEVSTAPARLASLIDQIMSVDPDSTLLVAQLICNSNAQTQSNINGYNAQIPAIVQARANAGKHIAMVSMSALTTADLYDGLHPNDSGYQKMANAWDAAVQNVVAAGWITPQSNAPVLTGNCEIVNVASNLALDVYGASDTSGTAIIQWPFDEAANQIWNFAPTSGGFYQLTNHNSGLDVNVTGASAANGAPIVQWPYGSQGNDQWIPVYHWDGTYSFYNQNSNLALDDPGATTTQGTQLDQYWPNGSSAQKFIVFPQDTIANGTYTLAPACATGSRLDGSGVTSGTNLIIWGATGGANQRWTFTANAGGTGYNISPASAAGLSLDVTAAGTYNGVHVDIWTSNGTNAQKWGLTAVSGGYTLAPLCAAGSRLDVAAGGSANGTTVDIYQANNTAAQTWNITPG